MKFYFFIIIRFIMVCKKEKNTHSIYKHGGLAHTLSHTTMKPGYRRSKAPDKPSPESHNKSPMPPFPKSFTLSLGAPINEIIRSENKKKNTPGVIITISSVFTRGPPRAIVGFFKGCLMGGRLFFNVFEVSSIDIHCLSLKRERRKIRHIRERHHIIGKQGKKEES